MTGLSIPSSRQSSQTDGLRPVNLQTDLNDLADLIEAAFSSSIDSGGRAAIREMRQLSRLGAGLRVLSHLNDLAQGMSLGYVWTVDGRVVGNVSVYPADMPKDLGKIWIIANVAVYPAYRGRGIAGRLLSASLNMIRKHSGGRAILQVDLDNEVARHLYRAHGFVEERAWTHWRRSAYRPLNVSTEAAGLHIGSRRLGESERELALAQQVRPAARGGVDWLTPTHLSTFRRSFLQRFRNWLKLRDIQRLVVRAPDSDELTGWLQIENAFGLSHRQLTLMTQPYDQERIATALLGSAVRRFGREDLIINHPHDDIIVKRLLRAYQFTARRTVMHMRYDVE